MPRERMHHRHRGRAGGPAAEPYGGPLRITRFIEPCLLLLLRQDASHGYNLVEELSRFGFDRAALDPSIVYRALREMEQEGWVTSQWDTAGSGPPRRVYRVTAAGEEYLRWWIESLRRTRDDLDRLLTAYGQQAPER